MTPVGRPRSKAHRLMRARQERKTSVRIGILVFPIVVASALYGATHHPAVLVVALIAIAIAMRLLFTTVDGACDQAYRQGRIDEFSSMASSVWLEMKGGGSS